VQERLNSALNVSHVQREDPPPAGLILKHYAVSAVLYGLLLALLAVNPWFKQLLGVSFNGVTAMQCYGGLYVAYLVAALPVFLLYRPRALWVSKNLLLFGVLCRWGQTFFRRRRGLPAAALSVSYPEKHALMFLLIKVGFGPLMLSSAFVELNGCPRLLGELRAPFLLAKLDAGYLLFVHLIFLVDSALFFIGYHTEAGFLKNQIRYVETNGWRILVCLICYPPFNQVTISVLGPSFNDPYILVLGDFRSVWTWGLRAAAVFFLCLLTASTWSLFARASNLTNRGIVTWGPYRWIRHPGYLAKNLFWLMTIIPFLIPNPASVYFSWSRHLLYCLGSVCGFAAWATIYFLRAVTEEQFLRRDPEYVAYCQRVKYRFLPGVY